MKGKGAGAGDSHELETFILPTRFFMVCNITSSHLVVAASLAGN